MITYCIDVIKAVVDSLEQLSTVVVAIMGFVTAMVVAKITSGLELKKTLCLRKVEVYEAAMRQLVLKINIYANFLNTLRGVADGSTLKMRLGLMFEFLEQLRQIEKNDADVARLLFYTDLPSYDTLPLLLEIPRFMEAVDKIAQKIQDQMTTEERMSLAKEFNEVVARFGPLAETEYGQQQAMLAKVKKDIAADKQLRKLLRTDG